MPRPLPYCAPAARRITTKAAAQPALLLFSTAVLLLGLSACQTHKTATPVASPAAPPVIAPPAKPFEAGTLYALLTAELAGQRQRPDILLSNYLQQAERTQDPNVTAQAAQIARQMNQRDAALHTSQRWVELAPQNPKAHQSLMIELALANRTQDALAQGEWLLNQNSDNGLDKLAAQVIQTEQNPSNPSKTQSQLLLQRYQSLLSQHPKAVELLLGTSYLLLHHQQAEQALSLANRAFSQQPDNPLILQQQARLLQSLNQAEIALTKIDRILQLQPSNQALRLEYAKALARTNAPAAEAQFRLLLQQNPNNPELQFSLALMLAEQNRWADAQPLLNTLVQHPRLGASAHLYAGRAAQALHNPSQALAHFQAIGPGPEFLTAAQYQSQLLLQQQQGDTALQQLRSQAPLASPQQAQGFILLEAKLLTQLQRTTEAEALLSQSLLTHPEATGLLYARSLLYSDNQQPEKANQDLRRIIQLEPNNSIALNALGYNLSQNPNQLDEALSLVEKALRLNPKEPAIMDSLGWVYYQQGQLKKALYWLKSAHSLWPDPEVAAHYGEVLWVSGQKKQARHIWQNAHQKTPNHPLLQTTLQRFSIHWD